MRDIETLNKLVLTLGDLKGDRQWLDITEQVNAELGTNYTNDAIRSRYNGLIRLRTHGKLPKEHNPETSIDVGKETVTYNQDGTSIVQTVIALDKDTKADPNKVLDAIGWGGGRWGIVNLQISNWQQHTKTQDTKELYAVKFKLMAKDVLDAKDYLDVVLETLRERVEPLHLPDPIPRAGRDKDIMLFEPGIEAHLDKYVAPISTGESYNPKIAVERFDAVTDNLLATQAIYNGARLTMAIGNDIFNADGLSNTTTKGTPQHNSLEWRESFRLGVRLYKDRLVALREHFDIIDVLITPGNHDYQRTFYLYEALREAFEGDSVVHFREDVRHIQPTVFGVNLLVTAHGDSAKPEAVMSSIPALYPKEWAATKYREYHFGHIHHKTKTAEKHGISSESTRTISATDEWHAKGAYVGAIQGHSHHVYHKQRGKVGQTYVNFFNKRNLERDKVKRLVRQ